VGLEVAVIAYDAAVADVNPVGDVAPLTYLASADVVPTPYVGVLAYLGVGVDVVPLAFNLRSGFPPLVLRSGIAGTAEVVYL
jgi:hypothetical protein